MGCSTAREEGAGACSIAAVPSLPANNAVQFSRAWVGRITPGLVQGWPAAVKKSSLRTSIRGDIHQEQTLWPSLHGSKARLMGSNLWGARVWGRVVPVLGTWQRLPRNTIEVLRCDCSSCTHVMAHCLVGGVEVATKLNRLLKVTRSRVEVHKRRAAHGLRRVNKGF